MGIALGLGVVDLEGCKSGRDAISGSVASCIYILGVADLYP